MVLAGESGQRGFVKAAQDQLLLARIGVDVADGENARHAGLKFFGIDLERTFLEFQPPFGDRTQLGMQAEKCQHMIGSTLLRAAIAPLHVQAGDLLVILVDGNHVALEQPHLAGGNQFAHACDGRRGCAKC
jgi:hypothetical protein